MSIFKFIIILILLALFSSTGMTQSYQEDNQVNAHPRIYVNKNLSEKINNNKWAQNILQKIKREVKPYVDRHQKDTSWIVSRLQMYWESKFEDVYLKGGYFDYGEGEAPVPTVKFSGSRDWATDYMDPALKDIKPYMDNSKGMYLQNGAKEGNPWEWTPISNTGHIIDEINERILELAQKASFLYWHTKEEKYAVFAEDIFFTYMKGMYYRNAPKFLDDHHNKDLVGLATFEVIHENLVVDLTLIYDFLYQYFQDRERDLSIVPVVFKRWADQIIKNGVPDNNWNIFQARFITYLALALEGNEAYKDGKGRQYYLDQMLYHNSEHQYSFDRVFQNFDPETGIWEESPGYSINVPEDILNIFTLIDNATGNNLLRDFPIVGKAVMQSAQYLFPNGYSVAFGDAENEILSTESMEMLISLYRKHNVTEKEREITQLLDFYIRTGKYDRSSLHSLFELFFYVDELKEVEVASLQKFVTPTFYAPNVSWFVQRNGFNLQNGLMISQVGSKGNHAHANGIAIELYGEGMVLAPESGTGKSYWHETHNEYFAQFPSHNTVIVNGQSDYGTMRSYHPFELKSSYPAPGKKEAGFNKITFSKAYFHEPATNADQERLLSIIRTSDTSGYYLDIFHSRQRAGNDRKHEYIYHNIGTSLSVVDNENKPLDFDSTDALSSKKGDLKGYDYYSDKMEVSFDRDFSGTFHIPRRDQKDVFMKMWMKGFTEREIFKVKAPPTKTITNASTPDTLLGAKVPTLIVRQNGAAWDRPFVGIFEPFSGENNASIQSIENFNPPGSTEEFTGLEVINENKTRQYIFASSDNMERVSYNEIQFQGKYGVVSEKSGKTEFLFLGEGEELWNDGWGLQSERLGARASLEVGDDLIIYSSNSKCKIRIPVNTSREEITVKVASKSGRIKDYTGKIKEKNNHKSMVIELPPLDKGTIRW